MKVSGTCNDYFGKGLSGGKLIAEVPKTATFKADENIIVGNVALYGAVTGEAYINGIAGERFCVRNSGATAVVEGIGDHGCEYMTGGCAVIIGKTGRNFAAGMSGGIAFVYDADKVFPALCNTQMVDLEKITSDEDEALLLELLKNHVRYTQSTVAQDIVENWKHCRGDFVKVMPKDYKKVLQAIETAKRTGIPEDQAIMEASNG